MIRLQRSPAVAFRSIEELEEYLEKEETLRIKSYEEYLEKGHEWCWCLVGNIVAEHEYGEEKEIKRGTKHFTGGTKVCMAPIQWGDGYERVVVIGIARKSRKYIEVVMQKKYIENFRMQKIYKPTIIRKMIDSEHSWWGDTDDDQKEIKEYLEEMGNQKSGSDTE